MDSLDLAGLILTRTQEALLLGAYATLALVGGVAVIRRENHENIRPERSVGQFCGVGVRPTDSDLLQRRMIHTQASGREDVRSVAHVRIWGQFRWSPASAPRKAIRIRAKIRVTGVIRE